MRGRVFELQVEPSFIEYLVTNRGSEDTRSEVVMVLPRPCGRVILVTKPFYPESVYRLPSGGVKPGESPEEAFVREVNEETGLRSEPMRVIEQTILRCCSASDVVEITSYIMLGSLTTEEPRPEDSGEQISGFQEVTASELRSVAEKLQNLTGSWRSWGLFRAPAHLVAAEYLTAERFPA
ncbi:MAG: NUDIX hydrolase [Armatimonadota bacterium]|nr:NUDIX hydrolase [Armatimonadota bacterium]